MGTSTDVEVDEVFVVLSGRATIGVDGEAPVDIGPGDVVTLTQGAIATSGAAARGAHIVDPRTGESISRSGSTTVIGPDLLWADVWATAAWVDPERAARLLAGRDPGYRLVLA